MAITKIEIASIEAFGVSDQVHLYFIAHFDDGTYQTLEMQTTFSDDYLLVPFRDSPLDPYERDVHGISTLFSGSDLTAQWAQMNNLADEIANLWQYDAIGPNSTSFVASILSMMGINLKDVEPPDDLGNLGVDHLVGGSNANQLLGFDGNDVLKGGAGDDTLDGGNGAATVTGDDTLFGDNGSDSPDATGNDVLFGRDGDDVLVGNAGSDLLDGGSDDDYLFGDDPLFPISTPGDDTLLGGGGEDELFGGAGNDDLDGGLDADQLHGDAGNDTIDGGAGDDRIDGGFGRDELSGGPGSDVFVLASGGYDASVDWGTFGWSDTIMDAEIWDSAVFGEIVLSEGTADGYELVMDEFENYYWEPIDGDQAYYVDGSGQIGFWKLDGDLHIDLSDDDFNYVDSIVVEDWSDGELGIHLILVDNRPGGGGGSPLLFESGGETAAADTGSETVGSRTMLDAADILDDRGAFGAGAGDASKCSTPVVSAAITAPEHSASTDQVALLLAA